LNALFAGIPESSPPDQISGTRTAALSAGLEQGI